jgi:hypothetical protein
MVSMTHLKVLIEINNATSIVMNPRYNQMDELNKATKYGSDLKLPVLLFPIPLVPHDAQQTSLSLNDHRTTLCSPSPPCLVPFVSYCTKREKYV